MSDNIPPLLALRGRPRALPNGHERRVDPTGARAHLPMRHLRHLRHGRHSVLLDGALVRVEAGAAPRGHGFGARGRAPRRAEGGAQEGAPRAAARHRAPEGQHRHRAYRVAISADRKRWLPIHRYADAVVLLLYPGTVLSGRTAVLELPEYTRYCSISRTLSNLPYLVNSRHTLTSRASLSHLTPHKWGLFSTKERRRRELQNSRAPELQIQYIRLLPELYRGVYVLLVHKVPGGNSGSVSRANTLRVG